MNSSPRSFASRVITEVRRKQSPVVVGLDPRAEHLPSEIRTRWERRYGSASQGLALAFEEFCFRVIDVVSPLVSTVKLQSAFFEQLGPWGLTAMARVMSHARRAELLVIHDGKRNDIGSTAMAYASGYLNPMASGEAVAVGESPERFEGTWHADAMTVNPYLGDDALEPFVRVAGERGAGVFVLVKTSNPGGPRLQDLKCEGKPVFRYVAEWVEELAESSCGEHPYGHIGGVVGATYPEDLSMLRGMMPHALLLIPGYGAQGATARDLAGAFDDDGQGALINSSRGIVFAYERDEYKRFGQDHWERAVEQATRDMIAELAADTPAGRLQVR